MQKNNYFNSEFNWFISIQLQDWISSKRPNYPNLKECISWLEKKFTQSGSFYKLTPQDLEDIEIAYEFQISDIN